MRPELIDPIRWVGVHARELSNSPVMVLRSFDELRNRWGSFEVRGIPSSEPIANFRPRSSDNFVPSRRHDEPVTIGSLVPRCFDLASWSEKVVARSFRRAPFAFARRLRSFNLENEAPRFAHPSARFYSDGCVIKPSDTQRDRPTSSSARSAPVSKRFRVRRAISAKFR